VDSAAILSAWDFEPSIIVGCAALLLADLAAVHGRVSRISGWFVAGVLILGVTLMSPLDMLADDYLFSAHMIQHLLLILVVPPFLLLGLPEGPMRRLLRVPWPARLEPILGWPPLAWLVGIVTLACWHLPVLYNAALANENIHILQHLSFLVSATIFWWPVFAPVQECRAKVAPVLTYILTGVFANGVIGTILLAIPVGLYPTYVSPEDPLHILPLIRNTWGLTATEDQRVGAVIMIIGGSVAFMYAAFCTLWLHRDETLLTS
jgi:cytochrome c oxidase assembly factor CtaG